jgi:hypothetical protein
MGDLWIDVDFHISFQQTSITIVDAGDRLYDRSDSRFRSIVGNCFAADLDGAKIFTSIVELYLATRTRESLSA